MERAQRLSGKTCQKLDEKVFLAVLILALGEVLVILLHAKAHDFVCVAAVRFFA